MVSRRTTRLPLAETADRHGASWSGTTSTGRSGPSTRRSTAKQRDALLVMATGSGKTRTVIALVDQLMRAGWVKRVLFLADRTALVNQAAGAFKAHLPNATTVNLVTEKNTDGRVYVSTYPTMMSLINDTDDGQRMFGPGYFDLVVIDEAHRSVYQKYRAIFAWFDSLLVGLTATPKDEVDRNTYSLFNLEDGVPTDAYSLDEAVAEGYLVPPVAVSVPTEVPARGHPLRPAVRGGEGRLGLPGVGRGRRRPRRGGGRGAQPVPVQRRHRRQGPGHPDGATGTRSPAGTGSARRSSSPRTRRTPSSSSERFDLAYPEYAGHFARVITHSVTYAQSLIDDFSIKDKAPHIAISVDMLDTGIDVPEVVNLVFFKLVRAKSKFWQMIGRGTRLCPDLFGPGEDKKNFYVFDFCSEPGVLQPGPAPSPEGSVQKSLAERLFEARLGLVAALDQAGGSRRRCRPRRRTGRDLRARACGSTPPGPCTRSSPA